MILSINTRRITGMRERVLMRFRVFYAAPADLSLSQFFLNYSHDVLITPFTHYRPALELTRDA